MSGRLLQSLFTLCLPPRVAPSEHSSLGHSSLEGRKSAEATRPSPASESPSSSALGSRDVFHLENGPSIIARASIVPSTCSSPSNLSEPHGPRIICKLSKPALCSRGSPGSAAPTPSMAISMPANSKWESDARRKQFDAAWLQLEVVAADDAALAAFHCRDLTALGAAFKALVQQDAALAAMLSAVAFSVAAPQGATCDTASPSRSYLPTGQGALQGCSSLRVSGSYMRDPDDGALYPALALELQCLDSGEGNWMQAMDAKAPALEPRRCNNGAAANLVANLSSRQQRNLLRSSTVLSAVPYISTLLDLNMDEVDKRISCSAQEKRGSQLPDAITGRVLLQNEGSLHYWGQLPSKNQTGAWQLLDQLLQDTPNALDELMQHLKEHRFKLDAEAGAVGKPWKKVVGVPSHDRSFAKTLRDQLKASRPVRDKDPKQILASWLLGGTSRAGSVPKLARPPGVTFNEDAPPLPLPATRSMPLPGQLAGQQDRSICQAHIVDENVFAVAPSKQVMSLMAAVSGSISKQGSLNPRRLGPSASAMGRDPDRSRTREGASAILSAACGNSPKHSMPPSKLGWASAPQQMDPFASAPEESDSDEEDAKALLLPIQEDDDDDDMFRYHEVQVIPVLDQLTGKEALLLLQTDITSRALMEQRIAALTESQLRMLEGMFPRHILEFVMGASGSLEDMGSVAHQHPQVTILFMDVVGFTSMSKEVAPKKVMEFLNTLFRKFDNMCDTFSVYKVETAGDCYIVAGSLMSRDEDGFVCLDMAPDGARGARNVLDFGQAMLRHARTVTMPHNGQPTSVRIGIHTGSVTSGLIGTKLPKFGLFGDTMNTSSRMESTGRPGCIQISEAMHSYLAEEERAIFEPSGGIEVKGKGLMPTFIWTPKDEDLLLRPEELAAAVECSPRRSADGDHVSHLPDATVSLAVSRRPSCTLLERSKSTASHSGDTSQWNLLRNALKASTSQETQEKEHKRDLLRSRLSRIARGGGAKSQGSLAAFGSHHPRELEVDGAHLGSLPKQCSMYMMQEILQLMKATVDD